MFDLLADLLKPDEFILALAGHVANEGAAKLAVSVVKAFGLAVLGVAFEGREQSGGPAKPKNRIRQNPKRRSSKKPATGRRRPKQS